MKNFIKSLILVSSLLGWSAGLIASEKPTAAIFAVDQEGFNIVQHAEVALYEKFSKTFRFVHPKSKHYDVLFVLTSDNYGMVQSLTYGLIGEKIKKIAALSKKCKFLFWLHFPREGVRITTEKRLNEYFENWLEPEAFLYLSNAKYSFDNKFLSKLDFEIERLPFKQKESIRQKSYEKIQRNKKIENLKKLKKTRKELQKQKGEIEDSISRLTKKIEKLELKLELELEII